MDGSARGICRTCGSEAIGVAFEAWVRPTFTDWDKLTVGAIICHACQFCFADQNATLAARLGSDKPQRMRNYSHFVLAGEWIPLSKGAKTRMLESLLHAPEVAVVAEQGQKHLIFRSTPGWWQIEEAAHRPFPERLSAALQPVGALYNGGFSKAEIEAARYLQHRILAFGIGRWVALEKSVRAMRGGAALALALFLAQKESVDDESGSSGASVVADLARDAGELQDHLRAQHLAAVRRQHPKRGVHL